MNTQFKPLVSIVIPVYNGSNYLKESIDSALNQTYENIEVIVVNDGSTDSGATDAIAQGYGNRIRYLSKPNGGCGSALNFAITNMRGEYFSWLSHDDKYLPNKIQRQINCLENLSNKQTLVYGGYELIDSVGKVTNIVKLNSRFTEAQLNTPLFAVLEGIAYGCSLLIPAKYFYEIGFFDETLPTTQDYALWYDFFRKIPICVDFEINTQYRLHDAQDTKNHHGHIEECNELWIGFINKTASEEKKALYGSEYGFHERLTTFLKDTPYQRAALHAETQRCGYLNQIKVSVIIPFYNKIPLLLESLDSVLLQTHSNYEIILVDDGSTDSLEPLNGLISRYKNIHYFRQENQGPAQARNLGILKSTGKYIAFLDADDLFKREKLERQVIYMEKNQLAFSYTNYQKIDINGHKTEDPSAKEDLVEFLYPKLIQGCTIATPTVMASREILVSNQFPSQLKSGEDVCLWINLSRMVKFGSIGIPLTKVRVSNDSHAYDPIKLAIGNLNIAQYLLRDRYHNIHKSELSKLIIGTGNELASKVQMSRLNQIRKHLKEIIKLSIALLAEMPRHLKSCTSKWIRNCLGSQDLLLADIEGFLVRLIRPMLPKKIWIFCTAIYNKLKGS